jgi:HSP20 family molecular chaperone IbpA
VFEREFERRFELPPEADVEHIRAKFVKGCSRCTLRSSRRDAEEGGNHEHLISEIP